MIDEQVVQKVTPDRRLEGGHVDSIRIRSVGLGSNFIDRGDKAPDGSKRLKSRYVSGIGAYRIEQVRARGGEIREWLWN